MWFLSSSSKEEAPKVVQTLPADVAHTLKTSGPTQQALVDIAALSFANVHAMRDFVNDVAPALSVSQLHQVTSHLASVAVKKHDNQIKNLLAAEGLVKTFLAYEFVYHKTEAAAHVKEEGVLYNVIPSAFVIAAMAVAGQSTLPTQLPEVAYFLFKKQGVDYSSHPHNAALLKSDRPGADANEQIAYLNAADRFIIKYFIAELDENRKEQKDRLMNDGRDDLSAYRGGRKVAVGLAVRKAVVMGEDVAPVFQRALIDNNISYDAFFEGGTKKYLPEPLFSVLEAARSSSLTLK